MSEPCWTGLSAGICSRGGIGCPLPHLADPPEMDRVAPVDTIGWNPPAEGIPYPHTNKKRAMRRLRRGLAP